MKEFVKELLEKEKEFQKNAQEGMSDINIFEALGVEYKENYHSKFIAYLINPNADHYQEIFAKEFLDKLGESVKIDNFNTLQVQDIENVEIEACIKDNRRVDILISLKDERYIIIENKLYAKDQKNQLKDYINHIRKKIKNTDDIYKNILTIYLHMDEEAEPSQMSLGTRYGFKLKNNFVLDSNDNKMSHYFKMDYKWIKKWIDKCINTCKNKIEKNEIKERFKNDMQNIIFSLNQYKTLLTWYVSTDDYVAKDYVLEFLKSSKENLEKTMILYRHNKNKKDFNDLSDDEYKKAKEIVKDKWGEICEELMIEFMDKLEKKFENKKIGKNILLIEKDYEKINSNKSFFTIYPEKDINNYIMPTFNLYFANKNYKNLRIDFCITYYYDNDEECTKYDEKIQKFKEELKEIKKKELNKKGLNILDASIYKKIILDEKYQDKNYEFIYYMVDYDKIAKVSEFKTIEDYIYNEIKNFIENDTIKKALNKAEEILKPSK
ncbi:PD-(D/E)XK nuclease family protein [Campylobacter peloridis]|uniref:PD-(D/E)XK nuclease family protein n=1 Tax=Campylobacter peloridis TaxID=488546 RepID=A0ABX6TQZ2_9BACT|nr:PD-(D/E)XK nuclease family protein [Campylobacter peloridis]AJC84257.1 PD-(D/E)XK nuclease domain protein [Campylobacter peloridis LMG 23910]QOQ88360.1 PD-(D/E)XK nuclease family protein [Campylobacter peloridis]